MSLRKGLDVWFVCSISVCISLNTCALWGIHALTCVLLGVSVYGWRCTLWSLGVSLHISRRRYSWAASVWTGLDVCFVGVPLDSGASNRSGTRLGPRQIRQESCIIRAANHTLGQHPPPPPTPPSLTWSSVNPLYSVSPLCLIPDK